MGDSCNGSALGVSWESHGSHMGELSQHCKPMEPHGTPTGQPFKPLHIAWETHGNTVNPWKTHRRPMGVPWASTKARESPMGDPGSPMRQQLKSLEIPWKLYASALRISDENPIQGTLEHYRLIAVPQEPHGSPIGVPWESHGGPVGVSTVKPHGSSMIPWESHANPMVDPCEYQL